MHSLTTVHNDAVPRRPAPGWARATKPTSRVCTHSTEEPRRLTATHASSATAARTETVGSQHSSPQATTARRAWRAASPGRRTHARPPTCAAVRPCCSGSGVAWSRQGYVRPHLARPRQAPSVLCPPMVRAPRSLRRSRGAALQLAARARACDAHRQEARAAEVSRAAPGHRGRAVLPNGGRWLTRRTESLHSSCGAGTLGSPDARRERQTAGLGESQS
jgi:hypothetical protein